ncbi:class I SAM-dependent methyltransferase [Legionella hackeliae]|uniref:Methyltransferase n=1 Tax=Legionella hackeliae TaxID=449 RepID=A0A0A8UVP1_LEGHA|nr:class I SAM-dependent methyltransferase [Legionella hackeliae]KTD09827.1 transcriptional regulator [Legionella hackeliae]CEK10844.1 methyltransferase [Legionella hackeliae]STX47581.1 transcriptional regulator [Legionella hackeliae]
MTVSNFDQNKAEKFAEHLLVMMSHAALALMLSIGHRTRLFDTMSKMSFSTSAEIAKKANLQERYVREWLNALVAGGIVSYSAENKSYSLPAEHAAFLTREASPNNFAVMAQFIPILAYVEDSLVQAFSQGGGVPYEAYPRFHEVMAEESKQTILSNLLEKTLPLVVGIQQKLQQGIQVLDIGCGYAEALTLMAKTYPKSQFTGYDLCDETIRHAQKTAKENALTNIHFEQKDLSDWHERERYDLITGFDVIHDQAQPAKVLKGVYNALKADGVFLMQDIRTSSLVEKNIGSPTAPFIYTISCMHCMTVSLSQDGAGLGAAWGEELAEQMLMEAGFLNVKKHYLEHDILNTYYLVRK